MAAERIGSHRLVVGAHYGMADWLAQRFTAIVMVVYTLVLMVAFFGGRNFSYDGWAALFAHAWMKIATLVTFIALAYHVWVGMRDIWMDYIKPTGIRIGLQFLTIIWLVSCVAYLVIILWRV